MTPQQCFQDASTKTSNPEVKATNKTGAQTCKDFTMAVRIRTKKVRKWKQKEDDSYKPQGTSRTISWELTYFISLIFHLYYCTHLSFAALNILNVLVAIWLECNSQAHGDLEDAFASVPEAIGRSCFGQSRYIQCTAMQCWKKLMRWISSTHIYALFVESKQRLLGRLWVHGPSSHARGFLLYLSDIFWHPLNHHDFWSWCWYPIIAAYVTQGINALPSFIQEIPRVAGWPANV